MGQTWAGAGHTYQITPYELVADTITFTPLTTCNADCNDNNAITCKSDNSECCCLADTTTGDVMFCYKVNTLGTGTCTNRGAASGVVRMALRAPVTLLTMVVASMALNF
jgi:hypothetical protein